MKCIFDSSYQDRSRRSTSALGIRTLIVTIHYVANVFSLIKICLGMVENLKIVIFLEKMSIISIVF